MRKRPGSSVHMAASRYNEDSVEDAIAACYARGDESSIIEIVASCLIDDWLDWDGSNEVLFDKGDMHDILLDAVMNWFADNREPTDEALAQAETDAQRLYDEALQEAKAAWDSVMNSIPRRFVSRPNRHIAEHISVSDWKWRSDRHSVVRIGSDGIFALDGKFVIEDTDSGKRMYDYAFETQNEAEEFLVEQGFTLINDYSPVLGYRTADIDPEDVGADNEQQVLDMFNKLIDTLQSESFENLGDHLDDITNDPKLYALLCEGFGDGDFANVQMSDSVQSIPVQNLLPCQSEIGLGNSLSYALKSDCSTYFQDPVTIVAPIVTYMGNFIIDGHHRWSQAYMLNPHARINAINFSYNEGSPWRALRNFQGAIATAEGEVPSSTADVANVYAMGEDEIRDYIESNIQDVCVDGLTNLVDDVTDEDSAVEYILKNVKRLKTDNFPISNAPERKDMPQTTEKAIETMEEGQTNI